MANLAWQFQRSLENSLVEFLQDAITTASLNVVDDEGNPRDILVRAGFEANESWNLPVISLYVDAPSAPRLSVGSNKRIDTYLIIIDIRALDTGMQKDLTDWVKDTINDGFPYYSYATNIGNPLNPIKTLEGHIALEFISNIPVRFTDSSDMFEKYRQNITVSAFLEGY